MEVVIINYGLGNIKSIANSLKENHIAYRVSDNPKDIENSDLAILPGVGSFPAAMNLLNKKKLINPIKKYVKTNRPLIGICLGMQILFEKGLEFGETRGLGLIKGNVIKIPKYEEAIERIPNIGWKNIKINDKKNPLLLGVNEVDTFYFTHSYHCVPEDKNHIQMTTPYASTELCASVRSGNIYGFQFHPEKSADQGLKIIKNIKNL
jgi:glutamine amidotransferase